MLHFDQMRYSVTDIVGCVCVVVLPLRPFLHDYFLSEKFPAFEL